MAKKAATKRAPVKVSAKKAVKKTPPKRAAKAKKAPAAATEGRIVALAAKRAVFVQEYLIDLNGTAAAIRAGYSARTAKEIAYELLNRPDVMTALKLAMDARAERTGITQDKVIQRLWNIASADPRELIELYRASCRYCWGKGNHYQFTPRELVQAQADYAAVVAKMKPADRKAAPAFSAPGGVGYDPRRAPCKDCPECFGEGTERVVAKDTRDLSQAAQMLYAGVKTTQHGLEIKMHDQRGAAVDVGRHLGIFKDKIEHSGDVTHHHKSMESLLDDVDGEGTGLPKHADDARAT